MCISAMCICIYICLSVHGYVYTYARLPEQGGRGQMPPLPPCNDFSIAKVTLFEFTSRGKFLPNEYIDCAVAMLRCWIHSSLFVSWHHSYCLFYITDYCKHIKHFFNQSVELYVNLWKPKCCNIKWKKICAQRRK